MSDVKLIVDTGYAKTRHGEKPIFTEGLYQLSNNCYSWMVPNGSWGETNIGLIDCNGKSVLVDTCWDVNLTMQMLNMMQPVLSRSPIETVINTHSDGDHCWGNQLFKDRQIIATNGCKNQMHHVKPQSMTGLKTGCKALRYLPIAGINHFSNYMLDMMSPYDYKNIEITSPTQTFETEHCLNVNGKEIILYEVGPAHTSGDAIVYIPDESVVYAGDIAFIGETPVMWSGPIEGIVSALQKVLDLNAKIMIPGHGPMARRKDIQRLIEFWNFSYEQLHYYFQKDFEPHLAASAVLKSEEYLRSAFAQWGNQERMVTNATTLYRHWGADLSSLPEPLGTMNLMRKQACVAHDFVTSKH